MDFAERAEHRDLRAAVASIASGFGPQYYAQHAAEHTPCDELWAKLGEAGFIGVNIPAEYGVVGQEGDGFRQIFATEYGLLPYWASARLLRVAPVNREMILNYVAQPSLGLPRSY